MSGPLPFWLILPVLASIFYTASSLSQNYCIDVAVPKKHAGAYIATHLLAFFVNVTILLCIFGRVVFMLPLINAVGIAFAGTISVIAAVFHYKALQLGDVVDITIYGEIAPLISLALSVIILNQTITTSQLIAFVLIMAASLVIVFSDCDKKTLQLSPNFKVARITLLSTFFSVLADTVYAFFLKGFTLKNYQLFAQSFFYFEVGSIVTVIICLIFFSSWRRALKKTFTHSKKRKGAIVSVLIDNAVVVIAEFLYRFSLIIVPVLALLTVINRVSGLVFGIIFAIFLGRHFPKIAHAKRITRRLLCNYFIAGILIIVGLLLING